MTIDGDPSLTPQAHIDRDVLRDLTQQATEPGALYGRDLQFTPQHREQLKLVTRKAEELLAPARETAEYIEYERLLKEGADKGVLMAFTTHEGTNVPMFVVNGGTDATVKKVRIPYGNGEPTPGIEVPEETFRVIDLTKTSGALAKLSQSSDETLKGRSAKSLGEDLRRMSDFFHANGLLDQ